VSLDGTRLIVGAPEDDEQGEDTGAIYIHELVEGRWFQMVKLTAPDASAHDEFGGAVALAGDVGVVGAQHDGHAGIDSGSAYVLRYNGSNWVHEQKLTASDAGPSQRFGWSVAISGDVALVGARGVNSFTGAAYLFRHEAGQWTEEQMLTASDAATGDRFGSSVALSGDYALVGAPRDDDGASNSGSVYVFQFTGGLWDEVQKLRASNPSINNGFGYSLSTDADLAVVGAHWDFPPEFNEGAAYVFRLDGGTWTQEAELVSWDGQFDDQFGRSVAVHGTLALIGAVGDDDAGSSSGSAYLFAHDGVEWSSAAKLLASDGSAGDELGISVALGAQGAALGAPAAPGAGSDGGAAYLVTNLGDCNGNGTRDLCDVASGSSSDDNANGTPDECECPWDTDGSSAVGITDLLGLLASWGSDPGGPPDFNGDGTVGISDLLALLGNWGPCP
jgi:hypothetical protein